MTKKGLTKKTWFKIGVVALLIIGTAVIILASMLVYGIFFSGSKSTAGLSNSLADFAVSYGDNQSGRDLPRGVKVVSSTCEISEDEKSFTYTITVKNTKRTRQGLALQVFLNEKFISTYGQGVKNPIVFLPQDEGITLDSNEEKTLTYRGVVFGSGAEDLEKFRQNIEFVYLELVFTDDTGRIMLPVEFV